MKVAALLIAFAGSSLAAIGNVRVLGTTATQALIAYTAPDGSACTVQISQNAGLTPLVLDVDPGIFANSNIDLSRPGTVATGRARVVPIGQRTAQYATAGTYSGIRHFSRALQAYTPYFGAITCPSTGDTVNFTFSTANIPTGSTYGDPWLSDPLHPGDQPWPESVGGLATESFIDPLTGVLLQRLGLRGNNWGSWNNVPFGSAFNQGQTSPCDTAGPWSSPCNVTAGTGSTTAGNTTKPLVLRPLLTGNNAWNSGYGSSSYGQGWTLDQLSVALTGYVSSTTTSFRILDACISLNGGASCASLVQQMTMGQSSSKQTVGQASTSQFGVLPWLLDTNPRFNVQESSPHSGTATVAGNTVTWVSGDAFSLYWVAGGNGHIRLSTGNDACIAPPNTTTSTEYSITGFVDGNRLTVAGTPPTGTVHWCANNFAVLVWRDQAPTDGSTVTLTAASMAVIESTSPTYPDNGAGTACLNRLVNGGYFCLFGGLYWINPTTGSTAYYGYMVGAGKDGSGNYIANPWKTIGLIPAGETANIDQSQTNLTFYTFALDPNGGGPLVIQGVFNPASITQPAAPYGNGSQIQNASVTSATAYSTTYSNGLTFTNLTPQVSAAQSVVNQMSRFDPTFNAAQFSSGPNGWNCVPYGMSTGVFYFTCYSVGQDSPGWIFAFSPGDANPAHAGQSGGPQIIGAMNTFNTPSGPVSPAQTAYTGRSLHSVAETGETGWVQIQGNGYPPVNTSSIASVPASSASCSTFGLTGTNQCILININSHTGGGVTGYEPYFTSPNLQFQFTGAPGEMRTVQVGDTACVAASTVVNCQWYSQQQELMTLAIKNYNGVNGAWVFQRNGYGAELAITSGPLTLCWISPQWSIPPRGTTENGSMAAYWNPQAGCGGSPDQHGDCLIQDTNNTSGHGEWRDGGAAVATNVPSWAQSIWGWPTDYQTTVGSVPDILHLPFGNVTPYQAPALNYTSTNPPFAGVYGHPWGFDAGSHPNAAGATASAYEAIRGFDNTPVQGGANEPSFTSVSGQLYVATPSLVTDPDDFFGSGSLVGINRKLMAQGNSCGSHPLIDIS